MGLSSNALLVHYDAKQELRLACDASSYGLGVVISHVMDDGQERPKIYCICIKDYAKIEKEALSLVFGVKHFHQFLYGHKLTLVTDHKPLQAILGPKSAVPTLAAARMQRWALVLSAYDYDLMYRRSEEHSNTGGLSRLPCQESRVAMKVEVYNVGAVCENFPIMAVDIAEATIKDPLLCKV